MTSVVSYWPLRLGRASRCFGCARIIRKVWRGKAGESNVEVNNRGGACLICLNRPGRM